MTDEPVLVLGSTGTVGRRVTAALTEHGVSVAAASRGGPVRFDWSDPTTWDVAIDGSTCAFVMAPDGVEVDPSFIERAVERGVTTLVLLSSRATVEMNDQRLLAAEKAVRESGADWTIVRADWFDQNFSEGFLADAVAAGEVVVPLGDMAQGFVDAADIAAVAATALTEPGHAGMTYEVTGPEALAFQAAVDAIAATTGRPIRFRGDADAYRETMIGFGLDPAQVDADIAAFDALREGGDTVPTDDVRRVTGRRPRSFAEFVAATWPDAAG